jgi:hypothetical protein
VGYEVNGPFSGRDLGALGILGISITSLRGYPNSAPKKTIPSIPKKNKKKTKELHIRVISHDALAMTYKCSHCHGKSLLLVGKEIPVKLKIRAYHIIGASSDVTRRHPHAQPDAAAARRRTA